MLPNGIAIDFIVPVVSAVSSDISDYRLNESNELSDFGKIPRLDSPNNSTTLQRYCNRFDVSIKSSSS